jgi:hypothetical protein
MYSLAPAPNLNLTGMRRTLGDVFGSCYSLSVSADRPGQGRKQLNARQDDPQILDENDDYIDLTMGLLQQVSVDGRMLIQKDYRVAGEVWRVHKNDPDPFPSRPHAHCVGGAKRFIGLKLHLGTAQLFARNNDPTNLYLDQNSSTASLK